LNNLLNIGKSFSKETAQEKQSEQRRAEIENADLVTTGGFPTIVKYVVFSILGALNFRLFFAVIGGVWGVAIGCGSIFQEMFAIYCFNKQHKSSGNHRLALKIFSIAFTALSIGHAIASLYELSGLGPSIGRPLYVYSHYIAPVLIFGLMTVAIFVLAFTHWSAKVSEARAESQIKIAEGKADLATREAELEHATLLAQAELKHQQQRLMVEQGMTALLRDTVVLETEKQKILNGIPDAEVRDRIQRLLGVIAPPAPPRQLASASTESKPGTMKMSPPAGSTTISGASSNFNFPSDDGPK